MGGGGGGRTVLPGHFRLTVPKNILGGTPVFQNSSCKGKKEKEQYQKNSSWGDPCVSERFW